VRAEPVVERPVCGQDGEMSDEPIDLTAALAGFEQVPDHVDVTTGHRLT